MRIATCFTCTLYHLFVFSRTNLLTRCQVPVSCFLLFLFQKSYIGNILGIAWDENPASYFTITYTESKEETEEGTGVPSPRSGVAPPPGTPRHGEGPPGSGLRP